MGAGSEKVCFVIRRALVEIPGLLLTKSLHLPGPDILLYGGSAEFVCRAVVSSMEWRYAWSWAQYNSQLMRVTAFIITESMTQISVMIGNQSTVNGECDV